MKVILAVKSIYPFHPVGGVQKCVYSLAKYLAREKVDVEIVAPLDKGGNPRTEIRDGVSFTFLRPAIYWYLEYPIGWLGVHLFSMSLAKYLRSQKFDVLHSFDMTGYQYLKLEERKPAVISIFTDNYLTNPITSTNPLKILSFAGTKYEDIKKEKIKIAPDADPETKRKYFIQYHLKVKPMEFCLQNANRVIYEDQNAQDDVNQLYRLDAKKGIVVPCGVDVDFIEEHLKAFPLTREELGFKRSDFVMITVNRLAADKGVDKIVLALIQIKKTIPNAKLIIIGSGYQEKEIHQIINDNDLSESVKHFRNVPESELYGHYKISDLYISAFSYPGTSMSSLEAMAAGLPIITTAQPWLVKIDGSNGRFIRDNDPQTISRSVVEFKNSPYFDRSGEHSSKFVKDYDWRTIAQKTKNVYQSLLN